MIKNPRFSLLHAKNKPFSTFYGTKKSSSLSTSYILELYEDGRFGKINFKGKAPPPGTRSEKKYIVGACNGLVCTLERTVRSDTICVLNPITKESLTLPTHNGTADYVFGYSASTERYKVLKKVFSRDSKVQYEIITVGVDESWRKLDNLFFPSSKNRHGMVHFNGAFCWLVSGNNGQLLCILGFDIAEEKTCQMHLPRGLPLANNGSIINVGYLRVLYNRLCLYGVQQSDQQVASETIWEMEDYGVGNSWTSNGALQRFIEEDPNNFDHLYMLITTEDGKILLRKGQSRGLHSCCRDGTRSAEIKLLHYVESLYHFTPTFSPIEEVIRSTI